MDRKPNASVRVLVRPQPATPPLPASSDPDPSFRSRPPLSSLPLPSSARPTLVHSQTQPSSSGVVVVGIIGRRCGDVSQLINRIIDSNVFGSTHRETLFSIVDDGSSEEVKNWFKSRQISYFHDEERGILYLQLCSSKCPAVGRLVPSGSELDSVAEDHEFGDLQGMLFMFNVCHLIIYVQEGSRFDVKLLRRIRVLQSAKLAMAPFVRSRNAQASISKTSSAPLLTDTALSSSKSPPGRVGPPSNRNSAAMSMSGLGSYASLLPGQCTPVTLFVFLDDLSDVMNSSATTQELANTSSSSQRSSMGSLNRSLMPTKGSGSLVVLARPSNKGEGNSKKKLQTSLEAQIRFLIKKCRTLTGSEASHAGSRSGSVSSSAPLLTLDASRAVVLLDSSSNGRGESLDFASDLVEEVLNGKATPDSLLLENHSENGIKEDIGTLKEFIYRQADILRGKGVSSSGSAAAVGMAAVAAAAAAASTACGKTTSTPKLPSLEFWLSSSQHILRGILSARCMIVEETEISRRKFRQRTGISHQVEGASSRAADSLDIAVSLLGTGQGINTKFSNLWCQRMLPAAVEIYLKDLPACYSTSQHEAHLGKALCAFHSMVKGPSVQQFMNKVKDECVSIWNSGRQLCDAVSLTGRPCMYQRHDVADAASADIGRPHNSGFVFLHACACGRSRQVRDDPFDFEAANVRFTCFPDCDNHMPVLKFPNLGGPRLFQSLSWSVLQLGGASSYDPSKGLQQAGFSVSQKFLMKWTVVVEKDNPNGSYADSLRQGSLTRTALDSKDDLNSNVSTMNGTVAMARPGELHSGGMHQRRAADILMSDDRKISFGRGLPNITMRKPFSEVVAGSVSDNLAFPPLQSKKQFSISLEKNIKKSAAKDGKSGKTEINSELESSVKSEDHVDHVDGNPVLQIGSNVVPLNVNDSGKSRSISCLKHLSIYVGFEHECPHGHRFILSPELLDELVFPYSSNEDSCSPSPSESMNHKHRDISKSGSSSYDNVQRSSDASNFMYKVKLGNSGDKMNTDDPSLNGILRLNKVGMEHNQTSGGYGAPDNIKDPHQSLQNVNLDDGGRAFQLLNRNLPVYMNCPQCKVSKNKKDRGNTKFAGTISQLQRIFVVTPPFPVVLVMNPVVQFEGSCLHPNISCCNKELQFGLGCPVILPPESFISVRLPFLYGVQLENDELCSLKPLEHRPELTAWIKEGTTLQVMCKGNNPD